MWKGDLAVLKLESEEPKIPLNVQQVTKQLNQISSKVTDTALTLTKADPVMLKIIDPPDAQFFVNILYSFTMLLGSVVEKT